MSASAPHAYTGVAVAVPVTIGYERTSPHGAAYFIGRALKALLERGGLQKADIDGFALSSFSLAPDTVVGMTAYFGLSPRWIDHIPMGGASGVVAIRRAARAVQMGDADIVACIAADTSNADSFKALVTNFSAFSTDAVYPYGAAGPNQVFAMITRNYMETFGATREDFGRLCISQRRNAASNPHALLREPMTMEAYLAARPIAEPIHLFDCVMPCAGAEAFLVMSADRAKSLNLPYAVIKGAAERHNAYPEDDIPYRGGWAMERGQLFNAAAMGPEDMDFLQTYDDYPVISFLQMEDLGFCPKGEAAAFVRADRLPHNTSGGQLSAGQAGAAGGFLGATEALRRLTTGVSRAGLVSGYGMVIYDRCLCTGAVILAQGDGV